MRHRVKAGAARRDAAVGATRRFITDLVTVKVSASESADAVTVLEIETPPGGGIPPHIQEYEDETIHVLEGSYRVLIGDLQEEITEGDTRFMGRGVRHGFANQGTGTARMLVFLSPGGIQERFIADIGDAPERSIWASDLARIISLAPAYGIAFDEILD